MVKKGKESTLVTIAEVKNLLEKEAKKRELNQEQQMSLQHASTFSNINMTNSKKLRKELEDLDYISPSNAVKIVDLMPTHPDDVGVIFAKERFTLEDSQVKEIIEMVSKYA